MSRRFEKQYAGQGVLVERGVGVFLDWGTTVPTDGSVGYGPGCLFIKRDAAGNVSWYRNDGTFSSSDFNQVTGGIDLAGLTATAAEINRTCKNSTRPITGQGANLTVTQALHDGATISLDRAAGTAVTLPSATGSGMRLRFFVGITKSGGSDVITAAGAHLFGSIVQGNDTGAAGLFGTGFCTSAAGSTTITLNGTTTGGRKGDWIELEDIATSTWAVRGMLNASGSEATPFA